MKKILVTLIVVAMLFSMVGCGRTQKAETMKVDENGNRVITIIGNTTGANLGIGENAVADVLLDETGYVINYQYHTTGDENEYISLALLDEQKPDLIYTVGAPVFEQYVENDLFVDLYPLIEEYGPNIQKRLGSYFKLWEVDGKLPFLMCEVASPAFDSEWAVGVRYDLMKKSGIKEIETLDDWGNVIRQLQDENPTGPNDKPAYAFSTFLADDWGAIWGMLNFSFYAANDVYAGSKEMYYDTETGKAIVRGTEEDEIFWEAIEFYRQLYIDGYFDPQSFEMTYDDYLRRIESENVYSVVIGDWATEEAEAAWNKKGDTEKRFAWFGPKADASQETTLYSMTSVESNGRGMVAIPKGVESPEDVVKYLDYLLSDEGVVLMNRGIEGVHYDMVDGMYVMKSELYEERFNGPKDFVNRTGISIYNILGYTEQLETGQNLVMDYDDGYIALTYDESTMEMLDYLGEKVIGEETVTESSDQSFLVPTILANAPEDVDLAEQAVIEVINQSVPKLIRAETDAEFEEAKQEHLSRMANTNYELIIEFKEKIWQDNIDAINSLKSK